MARVFLGIGSNLGDRAAFISEALRRLARAEGVSLVQVAPLVETRPVGGPPQGLYLNTAVEVATSLEPPALLDLCRGIERALGRKPGAERWGPRVMDIDILLYDDRTSADPRLTLPHPRLAERRFALDPLVALDPDLRHPSLNKTMAELLAALPAEPALRSAQPEEQE